MKAFTNQSIPLVKVNPQTNQFYLTTQAINYLSSLTNPLAIITIAGLYRTGKSYLVNKLLPHTHGYQLESAFKVGTTTQSMTKGLNILATPITLLCRETGQQIDYLLIDSQGIGSCEQSLKYDTDLLILIFLISSTVVYNSMGAIDEQGLSQLQVVLKLKNCVQNTEHQYQQCVFKYSSAPPKFIWVLRDFSLQLVDKNGKQISADEYLQQCLQQSSSSSIQSKKKNEIRKAIKSNLGERHCYTLIRPTLKQEDLQHLTHLKQPSKIRKEFIQQIQYLKQSLFSGTYTDIKRINTQAITGKLFAKILSQYLTIINKNQLPQVNAVWNSVLKVNNQQQFQQLINSLKTQLKAIRLPISKQELKAKINIIQNRTYQQLQKNIINEQQYKNYYKQYIKIIQKLNKQLKQKNNQYNKNNILSQLHIFVKQNLNYQFIKSNQISSFIKQFIQKMKLKINGIEEGYQYLLSIINDIFFIIQQKYTKVQRQFQQLKIQYSSLSLDKNNLDFTLINLKKQYHQSLKTIAKLQESQTDVDKNYMLSSNRVISYESKIIKLQAQLQQNKDEYQRNSKINNEKNKMKFQQLSSQLKKFKYQYEILSQQHLKIKQKFEQKDYQNNKQIIFEQKMKQTYQKLKRQKQQLLQQLQKYKKQQSIQLNKIQQLKYKYTYQLQKQKQLQQTHKKKQQNIIKQFQNLKKCIKDTKASYQQTYQTIYNSDQVLKDINVINNNTSKIDKYHTPSKMKSNLIEENNHNIYKKYYQTQIQKINQDYQKQFNKQQQQKNILKSQIQKLFDIKSVYLQQLQQWKQKYYQLQNKYIQNSQKLNLFLKQLQNSKYKQRSLYQDSIVRLLNNLQKKQNRFRDNPMSNSTLSAKTRSSTGKNSLTRTDRNYDNLKNNVSFSHNLRLI